MQCFERAWKKIIARYTMPNKENLKAKEKEKKVIMLAIATETRPWCQLGWCLIWIQHGSD